MDPLVQEKLHGNGVLFAAAGNVEKHSVTAMLETPADGHAALRINTVAARGGEINTVPRGSSSGPER